MASISLRRTKGNALIGLPPKTLQTCYVELSVEEREVYDQIEGRAKSVIQEFINDGTLVRNYSTVLGILLRLRQICTNLALLPPDLRAMFPSSNIEGIQSCQNLEYPFSLSFVKVPLKFIQYFFERLLFFWRFNLVACSNRDWGLKYTLILLNSDGFSRSYVS